MNDKCILPLQQTRRKLEDVGKKLEILYDKLREHVVSEEEEDGLGRRLLNYWSWEMVLGEFGIQCLLDSMTRNSISDSFCPPQLDILMLNNYYDIFYIKMTQTS